MKTTKQKRDKKNGQYACELDTVCVCGHRCGEHAAVRFEKEQPCFADGCDCKVMKKAKK